MLLVVFVFCAAATASVAQQQEGAIELPDAQAKCELCRQLWASALQNFGEEAEFVPHDIITADKTCRQICSRVSAETHRQQLSAEERQRMVCDGCIRLVDYWRQHKDDPDFSGEQDAKELMCDRFVTEARGDCEHTVSMYVTDIRTYFINEDIDSQSICYLNHRLCKDIVSYDNQFAQILENPEDDAQFNRLTNQQ